MRFLLASLLLAALITPRCATAADERYLYLSTPDGAQQGGSGNGILVFDIDQDHQFVKRIDLPVFKEGIRGFVANAKRHAVYYTTTSRRMGCFDVETEKILWDHVYSSGCDRAAITPQGDKLYVPTGWWNLGPESGFLVVNAETGSLIRQIPVNRAAHNSLCSLDGKLVFLGTETQLTLFDTRTDQVIKHIKGVGESGVFPFTVDSRNQTAYVCLGKHVGFDVVDLNKGEILHRILAGDRPIRHRTHGVGLTPDESEIWISDQEGKKLFIFDATQMPPAPKGHIDLSAGGHGWITFSLDGKYAWCHTPDVIDVKTRKIVATLKDEHGKPVSGSKFVEIHFRHGKVIRVGDQFGLGRAHATE